MWPKEFLIIVVLLLSSYGCDDNNGLQVLQHFEIIGLDSIALKAEESGYILLTDRDEDVKNLSVVNRVFDLANLEVQAGNRKVPEKLKLLDTLIYTNYEVRRYIYGMGKIDGLSLIGVDQKDQLLFIVNPSWRSGAVSEDFIIKYEQGTFSLEIFKLNLPKPPSPSVLD